MNNIIQTRILFLFIICFCLKNSRNEDNYYYIEDSKGIIEDKVFGIYSEIIIQNSNEINIKLNKTDIYFEFLTYEVIPNYGKLNVSICNNSFNNQSENNNIIIRDYKSYFYSIDKDNYKNQTLVIKCIEGVKDDDESKCIAKVNVYTNNDIILMDETNNNDIILYKYISKNNENHYFLNGTNAYLYINLFSGSIKVNPHTKPFNNNFYFDIINKSINLTIKAHEDSFYSIILNNYKNNIEDSFIVGSHYSFNITEKEKKIKLIDNFYYYGQKEYSYYLGIYSENNINIYNNSEQQTNKNHVIKDFYQNIISSSNDYDFIISNNNNNTNNTLYASIYQLDNITGVSLADNIPQSFTFSNSLKNVTISYPYAQKNNDLIFNFLLNKYDIYYIKIYLNDNYLRNLTIENNDIILPSDQILTNCSNFLHICKVLIYIEPKNDNSKNSNLIITAKTELPKRKKSIIILILLSICGIGLFIMIVLVLFKIIKMLKKMEDLEEKLRKTYFEKEMFVTEEEDKDALTL